jgi:hypothetical protein
MSVTFKWLRSSRLSRLVQLHDQDAGVSRRPGDAGSAGLRPLPEERSADARVAGRRRRWQSGRWSGLAVRGRTHHFKPAGGGERQAQRIKLSMTSLGKIWKKWNELKLKAIHGEMSVVRITAVRIQPKSKVHRSWKEDDKSRLG